MVASQHKVVKTEFVIKPIEFSKAIEFTPSLFFPSF